jgi:WD40 repeat protein
MSHGGSPKRFVGFAVAAALLGAGLQPARSLVSEHATVDRPTGEDGGILNDIAFSPDGGLLAAVGGHQEGGSRGGWSARYLGNVGLWETKGFKRTAYAALWETNGLKAPIPAELRHREVKCVAFSPDGKTLATGDGSWESPGEVVLWDPATLKPRARLKGHSGWVESLSFSPDGKTLATCGWIVIHGERPFQDSCRGEVRLWEVASGRELFSEQYPDGFFMSIAYSPDGASFATTGRDMSGGMNAVPDGEIRVWDAVDRRVRLKHRRRGSIEEIKFTKLPNVVVSGWDDGTLVFLDVAAGKELGTLWPKTRHPETARALGLAVSPDGGTLAVGLGSWNRFGHWGELHFVDVRKREEIESPVLSFDEPVMALDFSPRGDMLAVATGARLKIFDFHNP